MKKIFLILTLSLLASNNLFAENLNWFFNKWLFENGHHQYLTMKENPVCEEAKKYSNILQVFFCDYV